MLVSTSGLNEVCQFNMPFFVRWRTDIDSRHALIKIPMTDGSDDCESAVA